MKSAGMNLFCRLIEDKDTEKFQDLQLKPSYFVESEQEVFSYLVEYVLKYGKLPDYSVFDSTIKGTLPEITEPTQYYVDQLETRYMKTAIQDGLVDIGDMLKGAIAPSPKDIVSELAKITTDLSLELRDSPLFDFGKGSLESVWDIYDEKQLDPEGGIKIGWPTADKASGGLRGGDIVSIVGRPASGKSYVMLKMAHHMWHHQGLNVLFVTVEMSRQDMMNRLTAIHTQKPVTNLLKGQLSTKAEKEMKKMMKDMQSKKNDFYFFDGGAKTFVDDIAMKCHELKPDVVFIDGAYLLQHHDSKLDRYRRVAENCDLMKFQLARDFDIPVLASFQFNRDMVKNQKKNSKTGLEDIAYSDVIGQISSIVLGLLDEDNLSIEKRRRIDTLKGREGETGDWLINWDFNRMDFEESLMQNDTEILYS